MQKTFYANLAISLLLNLLVKPFSVLVIDAGVQRIVGNHEYGSYFTLLSLSLVFNIFLDLGINNYTTRSIAQDESKLTAHFLNLGLFRIILFFFYCILVFCTAFILGYGKNELWLLICLVFNQFIIQSITFVRSHFAGLHLFKLDSFISVLDRLILIIIIGFLLLYNPSKITVHRFVYAQSFGYCITFIFALLAIHKKINHWNFKWNWAYTKNIINQSLPYAFLILLMLLYNRSDAILLKQIHPNGEFQVGIYAQGFRLLDALYMFGMIFAGLLFPMFSRLIHNSSNELKGLLQQSALLLIGGGIGVAFITICNAHYILQLIYHETVHQTTIDSFKWLMASFIGICVNFIFGTLLTANGTLKTLNIISFIGVIISIGLNIFLIPTKGALGSSIAAFCTQSLVSILLVIYAYRKLKLGLTSSSIFRILGLFLFFSIFIFGFNKEFIGWWRFATTIAITFIGFLIFSVFNLKTLMTMIKD